jgi:hypothetical protein
LDVGFGSARERRANACYVLRVQTECGGVNACLRGNPGDERPQLFVVHAEDAVQGVAVDLHGGSPFRFGLLPVYADSRERFAVEQRIDFKIRSTQSKYT